MQGWLPASFEDRPVKMMKRAGFKPTTPASRELQAWFLPTLQGTSAKVECNREAIPGPARCKSFPSRRRPIKKGRGAVIVELLPADLNTRFITIVPQFILAQLPARAQTFQKKL